jgi:glycosyltransferase involved in cell wall biosynthesis
MSSEKQQKHPQISFVVPVFNAERTIERCVNSLVSQSFDDIEILLVNNCSTDSSLRICNKLSEQDSRVRVFDIAEKGVSAARNKGIEESLGEFIAFVDADDWIDNDVCKVFAELDKKNRYDLFCYSAQYHKVGRSLKSFLFIENIPLFSEKQKEELQIKIFTPDAPCFNYKTSTRFLGGVWGKFYKKDVLVKNNLRFAKETIISEDVLFNTLALDHFERIGYTKECFYHYVQQSDSAQSHYRPQSAKYFAFIIKEIQIWLLRTNKDILFVDAANCLFVHYLFGVLKEDVFHKDNPNSIAEKKHLLDAALSMKEFLEPLNNLNVRYFSLPERILIWLLQRKRIGVIIFLFRFIR